MFLNKLAIRGWKGNVSKFEIKSSQGHDAPRWYLWDGGFLALGRSAGVIAPHAHHAIQIVISIDGMAGVRGARGDWQSARGIIVRPDAVHSYDGQGSLGAMLMLEPESIEGTGCAPRIIAWIPPVSSRVVQRGGALPVPPAGRPEMRQARRSARH